VNNSTKNNSVSKAGDRPRARKAFFSELPVVGPIFARLYRIIVGDAPLIDKRLEGEIEDISVRLIELDRDHSRTVHDLGQAALRIIELGNQVDELRRRLDEAERHGAYPADAVDDTGNPAARA